MAKKERRFDDKNTITWRVYVTMWQIEAAITEA